MIRLGYKKGFLILSPLFSSVNITAMSSQVNKPMMPNTSSHSRPVMIEVKSSGVQSVNQQYTWQDGSIVPRGFEKVCIENHWDVETTWKSLSQNKPWLEGTKNEAYIYFNHADGHWWIDEPHGSGVFIAPAPINSKENLQGIPPCNGWKALATSYEPLPTILQL